MGTTGYPEMSVTYCHYLLYNSPEKRGSHSEEQVFQIPAGHKFFRMFTPHFASSIL
jgi:hypothetical protein